ncbi:MAG: hypothetical protein C0602_11795 [Denitrovibrio sp.]|nr:MAG: hypothetical protein C0602_11795 [Denitrovibrio sp.]
MIELNYLEQDLKEMKAGTLYKYGKRVELAEEMYLRKLALKKRLNKILKRLKDKPVIKHGWARKKRQNELTERVESKLMRTEKTVKKLAELKNKYIDEFKFQREACGLLDHTFLDEFYTKLENDKINNE